MCNSGSHGSTGRRPDRAYPHGTLRGNNPLPPWRPTVTQPDVQATLQARFVDDDTLVRTGRALLEVNGHGWVMVPVPAGWAEQVKAVLDAAVEADTISTYVEAAEAAAASAEADRVVVEQAAMSASWSGDKLTVLGATSPPLTGETGPAGVTPHVGANGNWFVGETDTGARAQGEKGDPGDGSGDVLWSELNPVLDGKAPVSHDHTIGQVTGLQDELDGKAPVSHDHPSTEISDATATGRAVLTAESKAAARSAIGAGTSNLALGTTSSTAARGDHTHSQYATTTTVNALSARVDNRRGVIHSGAGGVPSGTIPGAVVGDYWLNETTMELSKITAV